MSWGAQVAGTSPLPAYSSSPLTGAVSSSGLACCHNGRGVRTTEPISCSSPRRPGLVRRVMGAARSRRCRCRWWSSSFSPEPISLQSEVSAAGKILLDNPHRSGDQAPLFVFFHFIPPKISLIRIHVHAWSVNSPISLFISFRFGNFWDYIWSKFPIHCPDFVF
jgi:hypothetical protein